MATTDSTKDYSPDELVKAISDLQVTKQKLKEQKHALEKERVTALQEAYVKVQELNDEQAQIHFGNAENGVSFADRLKASMRSMKKEIKKNENLIQLRGDNVAEDVDDITRELEEKEEILAGLLLSIKAPVLKSEALDQLQSRIRAVSAGSTASDTNANTGSVGIASHDTPSDSVLRRRELTLFENINTFEKEFNTIIQKREKEIASAMDEVRMHRNSCTKQLFASLDAQVAQILAETSSSNKRKGSDGGNGRDRNDKTDAALEDFLIKAQSEHKYFVSKYDTKSYEMVEKTRKQRVTTGKALVEGTTRGASSSSSRSASPSKSQTAGIGGGAGGSSGEDNEGLIGAGAGAGVGTGEQKAADELCIDFENSWKVELQNQLSVLYEMERHHAEEEAALDRETIAAINSLKLSRPQQDSSSSSNIDEVYVNSIIDNLAKLYININESLID